MYCDGAGNSTRSSKSHIGCKFIATAKIKVVYFTLIILRTIIVNSDVRVEVRLEKYTGEGV